MRSATGVNSGKSITRNFTCGSRIDTPNTARRTLSFVEKMPASASEPAKFHVSLNVADVARSVVFYRSFLDREPARQTAQYAKFELEEPPLVLSLISGRASSGGNLNHLGIRLSSSDALIQMQARLET